jgi:uncharacterized peroxidase-related enzyme
MPRIAASATIEAAPAASQPLLEGVKKQLGSVPNMFRTIALSPAALQGYLGLNSALAKGGLNAATRERVALAVAEIDGCGYCLSAHSYLAKHFVKLDEGEIVASRDAASVDPKVAAALRFAAKVVEARGHVSDTDVAEVKGAGYDDAEVIEIVAHVALNTLTNYVNEVAKTDIDFPVVTAKRDAA